MGFLNSFQYSHDLKMITQVNYAPRTSTASSAKVACAQPAQGHMHSVSSYDELEPRLPCLCCLGIATSFDKLNKGSWVKVLIWHGWDWIGTSLLLISDRIPSGFHMLSWPVPGILVVSIQGCTVACHNCPEAHNVVEKDSCCWKGLLQPGSTSQIRAALWDLGSQKLGCWKFQILFWMDSSCVIWWLPIYNVRKVFILHRGWGLLVRCFG